MKILNCFYFKNIILKKTPNSEEKTKTANSRKCKISKLRKTSTPTPSSEKNRVTPRNLDFFPVKKKEVEKRLEYGIYVAQRNQFDPQKSAIGIFSPTLSPNPTHFAKFKQL